jgi:hypothetical protein
MVQTPAFKFQFCLGSREILLHEGTERLGCEVEHLVCDGDILNSWVNIKCFFVDTPPEKVIVKRKHE